jgi:hypothetical protein
MYVTEIILKGFLLTNILHFTYLLCLSHQRAGNSTAGRQSQMGLTIQITVIALHSTRAHTLVYFLGRLVRRH